MTTACPLCILFLCLQILANLGSHISMGFQRIFLILHTLTKFGTINQFTEMNFCFNEKHKKSQFCLTSSSWSIICIFVFRVPTSSPDASPLSFSTGAGSANPTPFFSPIVSGTVCCFFSTILTFSSKLVLLGRNSVSDPLSSSYKTSQKLHSAL